MLTIQLGLGAAVVLVFVAIVWRISSRRTSITCPSWLAWMVELDNPFAKNHNAASIVRPLGCEPGQTVLDLAASAGFREKEFLGNRLAYTVHLEEPKGR